MTTLLGTALAYWHAGLTPLPHVAGEEPPSYLDVHGRVQAIAWGRYKSCPPDRETVERWFAHSDLATVRLELLTGSAGHSKYDAPACLQILDFESADSFDAFLEECHFNGHSAILYRCVIERTPSGGAHVGFLCCAISEKPKLKLALTTDASGREKLLIELLQHQPCTVAPTCVQWKPDRPAGAVYRLIQGSWEHPYPISPEQREVLIDTCRLFNEVPQAVVGERPMGQDTSTRPGDLLNAQADLAWWQDLLSRHDWRDVTRPSHTRQGIACFQRPGKLGRGLSATYGKAGHCLYVFSSNAQPFTSDTAYAPFGAYALLEHDGDFAAAAKALAKHYGMALPPRPGVPDMTQPPAPDPDDPEARPGALVHHVLPDYLAHHPDPRVRKHWQRIYRRTAYLKAQLYAQGVLP